MTSLDDALSGGPPYRLRIDSLPPDLFAVHALEGREALSSTYAFDVIVTAEAEEERGLEERLLRRRAALTWSIAGAQRVFHGLVAAARLASGDDAIGGRKYHVRFVPRLWLLKKRRRSRIFQGQTVPEIVRDVLREAGIDGRFWLMREHPAREHCTQFEESDYAFVTRLLAEAGIWFTFASGAEESPANGAMVPGDTLLLSDAAVYPFLGRDGGDGLNTSSAVTGGKLYYLPQGNTTVSQLDKVFRFEAEATVRPSAAAFSDYDFERPTTRLLTLAKSNHPFSQTGADRTADAPGGELSIYDHHGPFLSPTWAFASQEAELMLRQERRRALIATAESGCPDVAPGHRFALADHPAPHLDRDYAVVSVTHRGRGRATSGGERIYENAFEAVPAEVVYPPKRPRRKSTQVALTATVVGPKNEEIHTNGAGQIRVQFHWDREGRRDERSSCWIRTMHPWAGAGWGTQHIPRVGMEVVVMFDGGDPDKPIVMGSLYNGTHPPPFALPGQKTRSGVRTQSTPSSGGYNELSFEDAAHEEQIFLRAQRDLDEVVQRDHTLSVQRNERIEVAGSRTDRVHGGLRAEVAGGVEQAITGDHRSDVTGSRIDAVSGDRDDRIQGTFDTRVGGGERREVVGPAEHAHGDDLTLRVKGSLTTVIGKNDAPRSLAVHTEGSAKIASTAATEIVSDQEILLRVGKSTVRITESGVEISGPSVSVLGEGAWVGAAKEGLTLRTKENATLVVGKKIVVKTDGASLAMEKEVKIDGSKILLNSPEQAEDEEPKEPDPPTIVELCDQDGSPLARRRFVIAMEDGTEVSGVTDADGRAEIPLKSSGKITFPDLGEVRAG
ncbi:MAG: type VI secretion system tip protein TssI/VgrG [Polyangiaceae bacterium]